LEIQHCVSLAGVSTLAYQLKRSFIPSLELKKNSTAKSAILSQPHPPLFPNPLAAPKDLAL
jgi:hypothetical protein